MNVKESDFEFTAQQIAEAWDTWAISPEFYGETCGKCKKTANVLGGAGWYCVCGHYNTQLISGGPPLHQSPDLGPCAEVVRDGFAKSKKWQKILGQPWQNRNQSGAKTK